MIKFINLDKLLCNKFCKQMIRSIIAILLLSVGILFASEAWLLKFNAEKNGSSVRISWEVKDCENIKRFDLERANGDNVFKRIQSINAEASKLQYEYSDMALYKDPKEQSQNSTYKYRIKNIQKDYSVLVSEKIEVEQNLSSVQKTWGMIKEMFR